MSRTENPTSAGIPSTLGALARSAGSRAQRGRTRVEALAQTESFFRGVSEFGSTMATFLDVTPGAIACVLSDEEGESIDYCHHVGKLSALDVQIAGAQLGQFAGGLDRLKIAQRCGNPSVLLQCTRSNLLLRSMPGSLVLVALLEREANLGRALLRFDELADRLVPLLR